MMMEVDKLLIFVIITGVAQLPHSAGVMAETVLSLVVVWLDKEG